MRKNGMTVYTFQDCAKFQTLAKSLLIKIEEYRILYGITIRRKKSNFKSLSMLSSDDNDSDSFSSLDSTLCLLDDGRVWHNGIDFIPFPDSVTLSKK